MNDLEIILAWRNHPEVLKGSYTQHMNGDRLITWDEHFRFWSNVFSKNTWKPFIIQVNDSEWTRDVGLLQFGQLDCWRPEVGIYIGELDLWGKNISKQALLLGLDWLKKQNRNRLSATIIKDNERSIKFFEKLGFTRVGEARFGEWAYDLKF